MRSSGDKVDKSTVGSCSVDSCLSLVSSIALSPALLSTHKCRKFLLIGTFFDRNLSVIRQES